MLIYEYCMVVIINLRKSEINFNQFLSIFMDIIIKFVRILKRKVSNQRLSVVNF